MADPGLDAGMRAALPDLRDEDVIGSPYCVRDYVVDDRFGGFEAGAPPSGVPIILQGKDREEFADFYRYASERGTYCSTGLRAYSHYRFC